MLNLHASGARLGAARIALLAVVICITRFDLPFTMAPPWLRLAFTVALVFAMIGYHGRVALLLSIVAAGYAALHAAILGDRMLWWAITIMIAILSFSRANLRWGVDAVTRQINMPPVRLRAYGIPLLLAQLAALFVAVTLATVVPRRPWLALATIIAVFVDWTGVLNVLSDVSLFGWIARLRRWASVPEIFPHTRVSPPPSADVLWWDGECGFCAWSLAFLERHLPSPIRGQPFQDAEVPLDVTPWTTRQMHLVTEDGRVVGGVSALGLLLLKSGRPYLAVTLLSTTIRPFAWFGYRLISSHRHRLSTIVSAPTCTVASPHADAKPID